MVESKVTIQLDGLCNCDSISACPLGKKDPTERCTSIELTVAGIFHEVEIPDPPLPAHSYAADELAALKNHLTVEEVIELVAIIRSVEYSISRITKIQARLNSLGGHSKGLSAAGRLLSEGQNAIATGLKIKR